MSMTEHVDADFREMPGTALAVPQDAPKSFLDTLRPRDRIAMATEIADAIKDVIVQRGWLKRIGESDHVYVEGWQFVASLAGASCKVTSSEPLPDGKGWQAHAVVVRIDSGVEIGAGSGMCSRDERTWAKRDDYALRAMSETRAMSRALRGVFSFIVELAGYRATPAEEMPDHDTAPLRERPAPKPVPAPVERVPVDELADKARTLKIPDFRAWLVANVSPELATRGLRPAESIEANRLLDAMVPGGAVARRTTSPEEAIFTGAVLTEEKRTGEPERRIQPRTNGRLFAMLSERGMDEKHDRVVWAGEQGVVVESFAALTESRGRELIKRLELIPPHDAREHERDEEDALFAEYEQQKAFGFK